MYPKVLLPHPIFFGARKSIRRNLRTTFAILSVIPGVCSSVERPFTVSQRPKINLKRTLGQDSLIHLTLLCIERAYANRVHIQKLINEIVSKEGLSKFFFQQIFKLKHVDDFL